MNFRIRTNLLVLILLISANALSQNLFLSDQQRQRVPEKELLDSISADGINEINRYSLITDYYFEAENYDSAFNFFDLAITSCNKQKAWEKQIDIVLKFDFLFVITNNYSRGILVHEEILSSHKFDPKIEDEFFLQSRSGFFNENIGRIKEATENYFLALNCAEKLNDQLKIAEMYNNIGNAYISIEQYKEAEGYISKGITICENNEDINIPILYNNMAKVLEYNGDTIKAITNYQKCLHNADGPDAVITSSINLSLLWLEKQKIDSAIHYSNIALKESYQLGRISPQLVRSQIQAATVCEVLENNNCQIEYLDSAFQHAKELSLLIELEVLSLQLSTFHKKKGNSDLALYYIGENIAYNDSINLYETQTILFNKKEERNLDSLKFASFKLESEKELLKVEVSKRNSILFLAICLSLSLALLIILYYRNVQRRRKILKLELRQKEETIVSKNKEILSANLEIEAQESALSDIRKKLVSELSSEYDAEFNELNVVLKQANRSLTKLERRKYVNELIKSTDTNFHKTLKEEFPDLTIGELKMMTLIRLNLGTEELLDIFNISRESLNKKRYRIRKKMKLTKNQDLDEIIRTTL
jgi:tetratricopeptide (TPR) repeat protein